MPAVQEPEGGPRAHLLPADPGFGANAPEFYADLCLCVSVRFLPTPALQGLLRLISGPHGSDGARGTPCRPHVTVSAVFSISEPCHGTTGVFRAMLRGVCALSTSRVPKCAQDFWATAVGGAKRARESPLGCLTGPSCHARLIHISNVSRSVLHVDRLDGAGWQVERGC